LSEPLTFDAQAARIDLLGQPLVGQLTAQSDASRIALLGDWSPLFRLMSGEATLSAGTLLIDGAELPLAVERGTIGLMRVDPLLPSAWSSEQFLSSSAELSGMTRKAAERAAFQALERLGLTPLSGKRLAHLQLAERRSLLLAHTLLTEPRVLCLEAPLLGLDTHAEELVLAVLERAAAGRKLLVALGDGSESVATRHLRDTCQARLRIVSGVVVTGDQSADARRHVTATVCQNHEAFARALATRGLDATPTHAAGMLSVLTSSFAGPCWRYVIDLGADGASTAPILDAALEAEAGLVELVPAP
jgi:ABC-type Na+ transport system ATPase subunit NatA